MKPCLKVLVVMVVSVFAGCTPKMNSNTANTVAGHGNCVQTSQGLNCNFDSREAYVSCMRTMAQPMGGNADAYCTCKTQGGMVVPSQNPAIPPMCYPANGVYGGGMMPGAMVGGGMTTVMPQRYANYPGSAVVMIPDPTPAGVIRMENAGGGGRYVPAPGGSQPGSVGGATTQDVEDLGSSQAALVKAHCKHHPNDPICCTSCKK